MYDHIHTQKYYELTPEQVEILADVIRDTLTRASRGNSLRNGDVLSAFGALRRITEQATREGGSPE
jgi:DNA-binding PadR family transcriptional regulator